jgi:hypothetical protein
MDTPRAHNYSLWPLQEYTVSVRWATVDEEEKGHLREFIYMCIKDQDKSMLSHVSNKIYTVYAALGKQDWPTRYRYQSTVAIRSRIVWRAPT